MTLEKEAVKEIILRLLQGRDYRVVVQSLLDKIFLDYTISFFKKVVNAKLNNEDITLDWYKKRFIKNNDDFSPDEIAIHAGLNKKTITNSYNSGKAEIVLDVSEQHYDNLKNSLEQLLEKDELEISLKLTIKSVSVDLTLSETLIVINSLAVKRSALRGGLWSTAGKRVEKPLMETLCYLYGVNKKNYEAQFKSNKKNLKQDEFEREIDFYLLNDNQKFLCEIKLMGKGNPESADAVIARNTSLFIADKLSDTNKKQLDSLNIQWLELRSNGYNKFENILKEFNIPHTSFIGDLEKEVTKILKTIL